MKRPPLSSAGWIEVRVSGRTTYRVAKSSTGRRIPRRNALRLPNDIGFEVLTRSATLNGGDIIFTDGQTLLMKSIDCPLGATRNERGESIDAGEIRTAPFTASRTDQAQGGTGWNLTGYGAVFNDWTTIYDSHGSFKERIAPGAFATTLQLRQPVLQYDHGKHPMIGTIPLGRFTDLREDKKGLFVGAQLTDNWLIQPIRDAIRDGGVTGMSFRFAVLADKWETIDRVEHRTILDVDLYETGPVSMPAYPTTTVTVS